MNAENDTGQKKRTLRSILIGSSPSRTLVRTAVIASVLFFIGRFVLLPARVQGISMEPSYRDGSLALINCLAYTFGDPERRDIVAIRLSGRRVMFLKRVLGIPGDVVEFRNGILYINGAQQEEQYVRRGSRWNVRPHRVGAKELFVAGDNRSMPPDEHLMGIVDRERIIGRLLF